MQKIGVFVFSAGLFLLLGWLGLYTWQKTLGSNDQCLFGCTPTVTTTPTKTNPILTPSPTPVATVTPSVLTPSPTISPAESQDEEARIRALIADACGYPYCRSESMVLNDPYNKALRLENNGVRRSDGSWSGQDYLVTLSSGVETFYVRSGGSVYANGGFSFENGAVRNDLSVRNDLHIGGDLYFATGLSMRDYYSKNEVGTLLDDYLALSGGTVMGLTISGNLVAAGGISLPYGALVDGVDVSLFRDDFDNFSTLSGYYTSAQTDGLLANYLRLSGGFVGDLTITSSINLPVNAVAWSSIDPTLASITDFNDVSSVGPSDGQVLVWNGSAGRWENESLFADGKQQLQEDYVIYQSGGMVFAFNGKTGQVEFSGTNDAAVIQQAIDSAGVNGVLSFREGTYEIDTELTVYSFQTWITTKQAVFVPAGNNRIINLTNIDHFGIYGTLMIEDPAGVTTSAEAVLIEDVALSYFEHIHIRNYYRGISMSGTTGGTHENSFNDIYMQVRDRGLSMVTSCHDNHFNQVWIKGPSPWESATGSGLLIATDGTQGGNTFDQLQILDMHTGMDLPGAFEAWFGNVVVDNAFGSAITISGPVERLFFDTVWTASSGDGLVIRGDTVSYADKISINKIYSWLNANYGIRIDGYVENLNIGMATVQRNHKGLAFNGVENRDIYIGSLTSFENTLFGVDGSGITRNVFINTAMIYDTILGQDQFTSIEGVRPGSGLFYAKGIARVLIGQSSVVVNHGLEGRPTVINLTPYSSELVGGYISARDAASFTVTFLAPVSVDTELGWEARSGRSLGDELLANVSAEDGVLTPTDWFGSVLGSEWSVDIARSGVRSLRLNISTATADWRSSFVSVESGSTYRLRTFVNGTGSNQVFLTVRWFSNPDGTGFISEDNIMIDSNYTEWTQITGDYISPAGAQSADVLLRAPVNTTADIYADEFSLREVN